MKFPFEENKKFIAISAAIFFLSLLVGILLAFFLEDFIKNLLLFMKEKHAGLLKDFIARPLVAAAKIFSHNFFLSLVAIFGGFLLILPPILLFLNGLVVGMVSSYFTSREGAKILLFLLPHGIFEMAALILASSFGLKIAFMLLKEKNYKRELKKNLLPLLFLIILLLATAAIIEVFVARFFLP